MASNYNCGDAVLQVALDLLKTATCRLQLSACETRIGRELEVAGQPGAEWAQSLMQRLDLFGVLYEAAVVDAVIDAGVMKVGL